MDNNSNDNEKGTSDAREDRGCDHFDGVLTNHLASIRLSHSPAPLYVSPPALPTAQAGPVENFYLSTRERQYIWRWLDEIALPEDW